MSKKNEKDFQFSSYPKKTENPFQKNTQKYEKKTKTNIKKTKKPKNSSTEHLSIKKIKSFSKKKNTKKHQKMKK